MSEASAVFTWGVTIICLAGTVLNVKKSIWCFGLWIVGNLCWMFYDSFFGLWSRCILDTVQLGFAVWGIVEWRKRE